MNFTFFSFLEREEAIAAAIHEAKLDMMLKEESRSLFAMSHTTTPTDFLSKGFKKPSDKAKQHGKARTLLMDMVQRAERKLMELQKKSHIQSEPEVKAEDLAVELLHKPSTLLTEEEMKVLFAESECESVITSPDCSYNDINTYRSFDGTCNNLIHPTYGAASTAFRRIIPPVYEDGCDAPEGRWQHESSFHLGPFRPPRPSARLVSSYIIKDSSSNGNPFTHIVMQWGQFLDHDMDLAPEFEETCRSCEITDVCEPITIPEDDEVFGGGKGSTEDGECLSFKRSIPVCGENHHVCPREQINDLSSFIDGSMVYGATKDVADSLAEFDENGVKTGYMRTSNGGTELPLVTNASHVICFTGDCYDAGDIRVNEQAGLLSMHTLFVLEHNRIAKRLIAINENNPNWDGEKVYQEARKIVGALIQKITYHDYLPKVLGSEVFDTVIGNYTGYDPDVDPSVPNAFATAAYRYGHSLIRPNFIRYSTDEYENGEAVNLSLTDSFFNKAAFSNADGTNELASTLRGLVTQSSLRMDEFLNTELTERLFFSSTTGRGLDLASLNIQRQRDHGMPKYGTWRNFCGSNFGETYGDAEFARKMTKFRLMKMYGSVRNADLWVAGIAEKHLDKSLVGPTFACIFGVTFKDVRDGDRFYFENRNISGNMDPVFTADQLETIEKTTLAKIICKNTNIKEIQQDVFVVPGSDNPRVPCSDIPRLRLSKWKETTTVSTNDVKDADYPRQQDTIEHHYPRAKYHYPSPPNALQEEEELFEELREKLEKMD